MSFQVHVLFTFRCYCCCPQSERRVKLSFKRAAVLIPSQAQESSQFLYACERAGVSDEPTLARATQQRRQRTFAFPALQSLPSGGGGSVTIEWQTAGRELAHTGLVAWDASYVLADWLTRNPPVLSVHGVLCS